MRNLDLPISSTSIEEVNPLNLVKYGLSMHLATAWGAARASSSFRAKHGPSWLIIVIKRFILEYGMNLALLLITQPMVFMFFSGYRSILIAELIAIISLPLLSVAQILIDYIRKDCATYKDSSSNVGLSVKIFSKDDEKHVTSWAFLNHYAIPVGRRKGVAIRAALHLQAREKQIILFCHAQNKDVAEYYLAEHPDGVNLGGARPLLAWNYSSSYSAMDVMSLLSNKFDPLGFSSMHNSGQIHLGRRGR